MSRKRVTKTLTQFGLSKLEARVYIYLSKMGPQSKEEIVQALKIKYADLNFCINNLCIKGVLAVSFGDPVIFCAFPFDKVLEILIKNEIESAESIRKRSGELLSGWSSKIREENNHS